jgi:small subunit ribosomal protein S21
VQLSATVACTPRQFWRGVRFYQNPLGELATVSEIRVKKGEPIDKALRRLKKKMDKEGTLKSIRNRRFYEKPSEEKRRLAKRRR